MFVNFAQSRLKTPARFSCCLIICLVFRNAKASLHRWPRLLINLPAVSPGPSSRIPAGRLRPPRWFVINRNTVVFQREISARNNVTFLHVSVRVFRAHLFRSRSATCGRSFGPGKYAISSGISTGQGCRIVQRNAYCPRVHMDNEELNRGIGARRESSFYLYQTV